MILLCVIAKLDEAATGKLAAIQKIAFPDSPPLKLHGHITLANYVGDDETSFVMFCRKLAERLTSFTVEYRKVEVLEGDSESAPIIVASPERAGALEEIHRRIAEEYNGALSRWTQTDRWYPHTTLLYRPGADLHQICREMAASFVPFSTRVSVIEFSRVLESGYCVFDRVEMAE